jgi:hypothetical protein
MDEKEANLSAGLSKTDLRKFASSPLRWLLLVLSAFEVGNPARCSRAWGTMVQGLQVECRLAAA